MNNKGIKDKVYTCKGCKTLFSFKGYSDTHTYCTSECMYKALAENKEVRFNALYNDWNSGKLINLKNPRALIRQFLIKRDGHKCSCCGLETWNGKPITLWTDHIDGNATNNHQSNFRLMCPNCDSQSETFGAKNYGNGRKSRGIPQYG